MCQYDVEKQITENFLHSVSMAKNARNLLATARQVHTDPSRCV